MRRRALVLIAIFALAGPLSAQDQGLQSSITDLFRFSSCDAPLCLAGVDPDRQWDFVRSGALANQPLIMFLSTSLGSSITNIPISNASSGVIFTFEGGVPTRQDISTGPIYAERGQTVGMGRFLLGANLTGMSLSSLRGVSLDDLSFTFTSQNVGAPELGDPAFENDQIQVDVDLNMSMLAGQLFAIYGLHDRVDLGVSIPIIRTSLSGTSTAEIIQTGSDSPHYFGSAASPSTTATSSIDGSAIGIGDVGARLKVNLARMEQVALGVLADVRFPTGSQEDLLGTGSLGVRGMAIASGRWGSFSPHVNAGYLYWAEDWLSSALVGIVGFDQLLTPWATLAVDVLSQWKTGDPVIELPEPVQYDTPQRVAELTNIPDKGDDMLDASIGVRLNHDSGFRGIINALVPLNDGGLRPSLVWTIGVEYNGRGPSLFGGS